MRIHTIIKTTALILALITASITTAAAISCGCGDICVNETGWWNDGGVFNASTTPIQAAVNAAASGDIICVQAGSYTENVDITTSHLTLEGASADVVIVTAASSSDHVFEVTAADYVNISGFTATGAADDRTAGIYLGSGVDCCNIYGNNASMNYIGIELSSSSSNMLTDNNVAYNYFGGIGIYLSSSSNNTLLNNIAYQNSFGIELSSSSNNTLMNNTANSSGFGIGLRSSSNNNMLTGNTASDNSFGIGMWSSSNNTLANNIANSNNRGIYLTSSSNNTLTGNTASGNDNHGIGMYSSSNNNMLTCNNASDNWYGYGIDLGSSSNNTLTGNTASDNWYGIGLRSSSNNNMLTGNTASDNYHGIDLWSSSSNNITCNWVHDNHWNGFYVTGGSTDNNISYNNIIANGGYNAMSGGYEWQFKNDQPDDVNVTNNWWGTTDNDIINTSIFDGQDDPNKGIVTYLPKLGSPSPCAPIPELPTAMLFAVGLLALVGYVRIRRKT